VSEQDAQMINDFPLSNGAHANVALTHDIAFWSLIHSVSGTRYHLQIQPGVQNLARKKSNLFLTDFSERIYNAIRLEFYKLPAQVRDELPRYTSPENLVLHDPKQKTCIAPLWP
jgi:hypothetical protein